MKKPRLFYWEDTEDAWAPVPERIDELVCIEFMDDEQECEIRFKRVSMTDEEFAAIPEA